MTLAPPIVRRAAVLALVAVTAWSTLSGCQRRTSLTADPEPTEGSDSDGDEASGGGAGQRRAQASRRPPAGATCTGRDDCSSDQVCVGGTCHYRSTSVAGEVLASAAAAQAEAGDWEGAIETYDQAFEAFSERDAPVPPSIACDAAELTLRTATDAEAREKGATRADLCFRTTVPGHPGRAAVRRALARLRFEGLDIALFDADDPAERFFVREASRPTVDAVQVDVQMPDLDSAREPRSHATVRETLMGEDGQRAIAECFIQDWEINHDRSASAEVVFRYSTRLRDMGSYDVYEPQIELEQTGEAQDGFEPCLVGALGSLFDPDNRSMRGEAWNQAVRITARIQ